MGEQRTTNVIVLVGGLLVGILIAVQRIVRLEDAVRHNTERGEDNHQATTKDIAKLDEKVTKQNSRVGHLEDWQQRVLGACTLLVFAAGFIGFAAQKWG